MVSKEDRREVNQNNYGPSWRWIVGGLIAALFAMSGSYIKSNAACVADTQARTTALEVSMSTVKTDLNYLRSGVDDLKDGVQEIGGLLRGHIVKGVP